MSLIDKIKNYIKREKEDEKLVDETEQVNMIYDQITKELKAFEEDFSFIKDRPDFKEKAKIVEDRILSLIEENDYVLNIQNEDGCNIGMRAANLKLENVVLRALDNPIASTQQDQDGDNIGMKSVLNRLEKASLKALDNYEASIQQDKFKCNIGMMAANYEMENVALKALDNYDASIQQDEWGENIGMYCARYDLDKAVVKALDNREASLQLSVGGCNGSIMYFIANNGLKESLKKAIINYPKEIEKVIKANPGYTTPVINIKEAKAQIERDRLMEEDIENSAELEMENESD